MIQKLFSRPLIRVALGFALGLGAVFGSASAQGWPDRPIRLIVPFPPGGGTDVLARLLSAELSQTQGWNIVVDNRPGAGGTLAISEVVKASPAGYELVFGQKDNLVIGPWLYQNLRWNPADDLTPVAHIAYSPVLIATRADSPLQTLADVVEAAKARPGAITYGSPGNGTSIHLSAHLFAKEAGVDLVHVPYRGSSPAMLDVIAGSVDLLVSSVPSAMGQIQAGKLRPLAVTSAQRSSSLPDVPTVAQAGIVGVDAFDVSTWYGIFAPKNLDEAIANELHAQINALLQREDLRLAIQAQGAEVSPQTREAFGQLLREEYQSWKDVVQGSGARLD